MTARAQSASSSTGMHSGAGTPRANEIVVTTASLRARSERGQAPPETAARAARRLERVQNPGCVGAVDRTADADHLRARASVGGIVPERQAVSGVHEQNSDDRTARR